MHDLKHWNSKKKHDFIARIFAKIKDMAAKSIPQIIRFFFWFQDLHAKTEAKILDPDVSHVMGHSNVCGQGCDVPVIPAPWASLEKPAPAVLPSI